MFTHDRCHHSYVPNWDYHTPAQNLKFSDQIRQWTSGRVFINSAILRVHFVQHSFHFILFWKTSTIINFWFHSMLFYPYFWVCIYITRNISWYWPTPQFYKRITCAGNLQGIITNTCRCQYRNFDIQDSKKSFINSSLVWSLWLPPWFQVVVRGA